jgi:hypothetical protein
VARDPSASLTSDNIQPNISEILFFLANDSLCFMACRLTACGSAAWRVRGERVRQKVSCNARENFEKSAD